MIVKDWVTELANEIIYRAEDNPGSFEAWKATILEHCPFKPDVAYMPVPRCDTCKHWDGLDRPESSMKLGLGDCNIVERSTDSDFGCVQWEAK